MKKMSLWAVVLFPIVTVLWSLGSMLFGYGVFTPVQHEGFQVVNEDEEDYIPGKARLSFWLPATLIESSREENGKPYDVVQYRSPYSGDVSIVDGTITELDEVSLTITSEGKPLFQQTFDGNDFHKNDYGTNRKMYWTCSRQIVLDTGVSKTRTLVATARISGMRNGVPFSETIIESLQEEETETYQHPRFVNFLPSV